MSRFYPTSVRCSGVYAPILSLRVRHSMRRRLIGAATFIVVSCVAAPIDAQSVPSDGTASPTPAIDSIMPVTHQSPISVDLSLAAVSDYRFRGVSLSNQDPAFQPSLTITHKSGFYVSAWGSNIASNGGANIELDLVGGYSGQTGPVTYGISVTHYVYPGTSGQSYTEFIGTAGTNLGPGKIGLTVGYAPKQANIGNKDNVYVAVNGSLPLKGTPLTLLGSFGIEDGAFGNAKRDWSAGVSADVEHFTLSLSYIDTARATKDQIGGPTAVFSVSHGF